MKFCIVIGDGMADHPVSELNGQTPLQSARIPVMDKLAALGTVGTVRTVPVGIAAGSDTAILSICGYDPRKYYTGRAPLEAAGAGVSLCAGDVAYRCNMVTLEDGDMPYQQKKLLSHCGGSPDEKSALTLIQDLLAYPEFVRCAERQGVKIHPTPSFRHIAVQHGADITGFVAVPPHDHLFAPIGPLLPKTASGTPQSPAEGLNELMRIAHGFLDVHPMNIQRRKEKKPVANGLWFWAEGTVAALPSLTKAFDKTGFVVSAVPLVRGIGALAGLKEVIVPGATGDLDTNYEGKADAVLEGLAQGYDFALMHVEAPDECTHAGDLKGKLQAIEWLDSRAVSRLKEGLDQLGEPYRLLILSDHLTLTETRGHNGEPVPFLLYDSRRIQKDESIMPRGFDEAFCGSSGVYIEEGHTLITRLFEE